MASVCSVAREGAEEAQVAAATAGVATAGSWIAGAEAPVTGVAAAIAGSIAVAAAVAGTTAATGATSWAPAVLTRGFRPRTRRAMRSRVPGASGRVGGTIAAKLSQTPSSARRTECAP